MGRAYYDESFFLPRRSRDSAPASRDSAREIAAHVDEPRPRDATLCHFDEQGDLVYGREIRLFESIEPCFFPGPSGQPRLHQALVVKTRDSQLAGHTVLVTGYPYSTNTRCRARLWSGSKDRKRYQPARIALSQKLADGLSLDAILSDFDFDPFRTDDDGCLRAYFFDLSSQGIKYFSNRRASKKDIDKAKTVVRQGNKSGIAGRLKGQGNVAGLENGMGQVDANWQENGNWQENINWQENDEEFGRLLLHDCLIRCWGICQSYEDARRWLMNHDEITRLLEMAMDGKLFKAIPNRHARGGEPPMVDPAAQDAAQEVLQACIDNVLCGTLGPDEYRGFYQGKTRSANQPDRPHREPKKQTVATHLWHTFYDSMLALHKRLSKKQGGKMVQYDTSQAVTQTQAAVPLPEPNVIEDFHDRVQQYREQFRGQPSRRNVHGHLRHALKNEEALVETMALTVAYWEELGERDPQVIQSMKRLTQHANPEIQQVASVALKKLQAEG